MRPGSSGALHLLAVFGAVLVLGGAARPGAPTPSAVWSGWYNLPRTEVDVRYQNGQEMTQGDHRVISWEFRNRHPFPVSFEYRITFQLRDRDWLVSGRHTIASGASSEPRNTVGMQILNVRLLNVVRENN
jgi:hypothetical protein